MAEPAQEVFSFVLSSPPEPWTMNAKYPAHLTEWLRKLTGVGARCHVVTTKALQYATPMLST